MIFRIKEKEYKGSTAVEVVEQIKLEEGEFVRRSGTIREFVAWSLIKLSDRLPPRELGVSLSVSDEIQARSYLSLRHDFGLGELID